MVLPFGHSTMALLSPAFARNSTASKANSFTLPARGLPPCNAVSAKTMGALSGPDLGLVRRAFPFVRRLAASALAAFIGGFLNGDGSNNKTTRYLTLFFGAGLFNFAHTSKSELF